MLLYLLLQRFVKMLIPIVYFNNQNIFSQPTAGIKSAKLIEIMDSETNSKMLSDLDIGKLSKKQNKKKKQ